ncbi:hypothetical protein DPMN_001838 [Dreissena polymorpha]|uniref:Uncharacterized protein n=1 Tax=Dreissena polymorpha TaxID=45954 RepID=A0A9D4MLN8_DREPO|nr:hypothetical protein DPMN_001838 [Dreissena polymorpha]
MNNLGWTTLESRRQTAKVVIVYMIVNNMVDINARRSVLIAAGVHTRGYANRYIVPFTTVNAYQFPVFPTGIRLQNRWSLPCP